MRTQRSGTPFIISLLLLALVSAVTAAVAYQISNSISTALVLAALAVVAGAALFRPRKAVPSTPDPAVLHARSIAERYRAEPRNDAVEVGSSAALQLAIILHQQHGIDAVPCEMLPNGNVLLRLAWQVPETPTG
jgi:hypothetical protein